MTTELTASAAELAVAFSRLESRGDIADLLEITPNQLNYYLYIIPEPHRYRHFEIPKRRGGTRSIYAPATALKIVQRKLNQVLQSVYRPKHSAHGFLPDKSILTNALPHARKRFVLNIDLLDFFPSINFGRVRGMFMAPPYLRNHEVATTLAQICCFDGYIPQGAPTSPIISNMICAKLDSMLQRLAKQHRSTYTRYADDITFSTSSPRFPRALAHYSEEQTGVVIGDDLGSIVRQNGFRVNDSKSRLQPYSRRQEVTGLTVNLFPNVPREFVRQLRGMLHAWQVYGLEAAELTYRKKYAGKHSEGRREQISFKKVVNGKLNYLKMIKGESNRVYVNLLQQFWLLAPELATAKVPVPAPLPRPKIYTEGKTDWKHLKKAFTSLRDSGMFGQLELEFFEFGDETPMGDAELLKMCSAFCKQPNPQIVVAVFDRDNQKMVNDVSEQKQGYKTWGNNVFSFAIPVPAHRAETPDVSIELYYQDKDIKRKGANGRRLYLSDEFDRTNNAHLTLDGIYTTSKRTRRPRGVAVIDSDVFDLSTKQSMALSKDEFADLLADHDSPIQDVDFGEFSKIFDVIVNILLENS
jgi:RNA-directed DNA polymerase